MKKTVLVFAFLGLFFSSFSQEREKMDEYMVYARQEFFSKDTSSWAPAYDKIITFFNGRKWYFFDCPKSFAVDQIIDQDPVELSVEYKMRSERRGDWHIIIKWFQTGDDDVWVKITRINKKSMSGYIYLAKKNIDEEQTVH